MTVGHLLGSAPTRGCARVEAFLPAAKAALLSKNCGEFREGRVGNGSVRIMLIKGLISAVRHVDTAKLAFKAFLQALLSKILALGFWQLLPTLAGN